PGWRSALRARRPLRKQSRLCKRGAASARRKSCPDSSLSTKADDRPSPGCSQGHPYISRELSRTRFPLTTHGLTQSTELDPIVRGKFEDILNGNGRWLSWSNHVVRRSNRCRF